VKTDSKTDKRRLALVLRARGGSSALQSYQACGRGGAELLDLQRRGGGKQGSRH
jgi:hypothetical protein